MREQEFEIIYTENGCEKKKVITSLDKNHAVKKLKMELSKKNINPEIITIKSIGNTW